MTHSHSKLKAFHMAFQERPRFDAQKLMIFFFQLELGNAYEYKFTNSLVTVFLSLGLYLFQAPVSIFSRNFDWNAVNVR